MQTWQIREGPTRIRSSFSNAVHVIRQRTIGLLPRVSLKKDVRLTATTASPLIIPGCPIICAALPSLLGCLASQGDGESGVRQVEGDFDVLSLERVATYAARLRVT